MAWTLDAAVIQLPLAEHSAVVRAHVVDRSPASVGKMREAKTAARNLDHEYVTRSDSGCVGDNRVPDTPLRIADNVAHA